MASSAPERPLWRKLAWFAGLWLASVLSVSAVSAVIRLWLR